MPTEHMGDRIKRLRQAKEWNQDELAAAVGVSKSAVSLWESGITANIKLMTFRRLLDALDTRYDYLIFGPLDERESAPVKRSVLPLKRLPR